VSGKAAATSGSAYGVFGLSDSSEGAGVYGKAAATSGSAYGVYGMSDSPEGAGVYALGVGENDPDLILGGKSDSNDNGVISSDPAFAGSDIIIHSNDAVAIYLDRNDDEAGHLEVKNGDGSLIFRLDEQGGVLVKDDEGQELFNLSKTGGAQFNVGGADLRVNGEDGQIFRVEESGDVTYGGDGIAAFPRPAYDSGWQPIGTYKTLTLDHNLGGNVDNYVVDLWFKEIDGAGHGINNHGYGTDTTQTAVTDDRRGAHWHGLTSTQIKVTRMKDDNFADQIRVRIWVYK
jgi:hypothetical protein